MLLPPPAGAEIIEISDDEQADAGGSQASNHGNRKGKAQVTVPDINLADDE